MLFALLVLVVVAATLLVPTLIRLAGAAREHAAEHRAAALDEADATLVSDPGRERRAEQRARELLRSCVNDEEWAMYRDLGFIRVNGRLRGPSEGAAGRRRGPTRYAYLIYPHRPVIAYVPETGRLLAEYCVQFPDLSGAISASRLPASDDVLAKWMALTGDEERLLLSSNMHLVGHQVDPGRVRRDLWRLGQWERTWARSGGEPPEGHAGSSAERQRT